MGQAEYTVLDVWGSWCQGCVLGLPGLDSLYRRLGGRLQVIGISTAPEMDSAFLAKHPHPWRQFEITEAAHRYMHIATYPTYLLFNREGVLLRDDLLLPEFKEATPPAR